MVIYQSAKNILERIGSVFAKDDLSNVDDSTILDKIKNVDGNGSGLDADLLRGLPADFSCSKNSNGYTKLPNGLILQWGMGTTGSSGAITVTFPITFPNYCFSLSAIAYGGVDTNVMVNNANNTEFDTTTFKSDGNLWGNRNFKWIAIGY